MLEQYGEFESAAHHYEEAGEYARAGLAFENARSFDLLPRAAEQFMLGGLYHRAGELYERHGDFLKALQCFQRIPDDHAPGLLLSKLDQAMMSLPHQDPRRTDVAEQIRVEATRLNQAEWGIQMLEGAGEFEVAAALCAQALDDPTRGAEMLEQAGKLNEAGELYEQAGHPMWAGISFYEAGQEDRGLELLGCEADNLLAVRLERARWRRDHELAQHLETLIAEQPEPESAPDALASLPAELSHFGPSEPSMSFTVRDLGPSARDSLLLEIGQEATGVESNDPSTRYSLLELVGRGGMGLVVKCHDALLDRLVALKFLPSRESTEDDEKTFRREARAAARLAHPGIITIHDFGKYRGRHFISMEYIEGTTLSHRLKAGAMPLASALSVVVQAIDAISYAHQQGVVHCDLKPSNVLLDKRGRVKIADFGLAKLSSDQETQRIMGTPAYMAPEQIRGEATPQSDMFALGVTMYMALCGERPGAPELPMQAEYVIPPHEHNPALSLTLSTAVLECLARDPSHRPDDLNLLRWIIENEPGFG